MGWEASSYHLSMTLGYPEFINPVSSIQILISPTKRQPERVILA